MNVPKLRFKEFNDEWKIFKISDIASCVTKGTTPKKYVESGINFIKVENIHNNIISDIGSYISEYTHNNELKRSILKENDILFSIAGALGRTAIIRKENLPANTNQANSIIRIKNPEEVDINYLLHKLNNFDIRNYIFKCQSVGAQPNLSLKQINNIKVSYPSLNEQKKIGNIMSLLDKKIELQTNKIEDLKLFKKGLLNKIFKGKNANTTIENCINYGKAGGTPSSNNKDYYDGDIPFLSISDITNQGKYIYSTEKMISQKGLDNSSAWLIPKNSLILSMYASYGLVAINKIELSTSQAMFNMIVNKNNNMEYMYYYMKYLYENNYYDKLVSTGTQANLNADKVKKIKVYLPNIEEQNRIANLFISIDNRLNCEENKLNSLIKLKKGLMQSIFV